MSTPETKPPEPHIDASALRSKLLTVPSIVVEKALILYVILTDKFTPLWVRALVVAALVYLINPLDLIPDALPGIGLTDDLAVLVLTLERLSRFVTPRVKLRAKRMAPDWLMRGDKDHQDTDKQDTDNTQPDNNNEQGVPDNGQEKEDDNGRRSRVPFLERFRIFP